LSEIEKKAIEFTKRFEKGTRVIVAVGTIFIGGAAPPAQPPSPPTPIVCPAPPQEAKEAWRETFRKFQEKAKSPGEVAGGLIAAYELLKKKKKDKKNDKNEDD
jgi:hypothetical protein